MDAIELPQPSVVVLLPLAAWSISYVYCIRSHGGDKDSFSKWAPVHDAHSFGVIVLSLLCLSFGFDEALPVMFSCTYFAVDLLDCVVRHDAIYTLHAILSVSMSLGVFIDPKLRELRLSSRGYLVEVSNLMLHRWFQTRKKSDFICLVVLFTVCRIIWFPMVSRKLVKAIGMDNWIFAACSVFYLLNVTWWAKMLCMLMNYKEKPAPTAKHQKLD